MAFNQFKAQRIFGQEKSSHINFSCVFLKDFTKSNSSQREKEKLHAYVQTVRETTVEEVIMLILTREQQVQQQHQIKL